MRKLAITLAAWLLVGGCLTTPLPAAADPTKIVDACVRPKLKN